MQVLVLGASFISALILGFLISTIRSKKAKQIFKKKKSKIDVLVKQKTTELQQEFKEAEEVVAKQLQTLQQATNDNLEIFEKRIKFNQQNLNKRTKKNQQLEDGLRASESELDSDKIVFAQNNESLQDILTDKSKVSTEEAKNSLKEQFEKEYTPYYQLVANKKVEYAKDNSHKQSIEYLKYVIQKYAEPSSVDRLDKTVVVPKDIIKGKLIGRGAKNLLYIEEKTGVDIIFEAQPNIITVSCFNLVTQETVRIALNKLIQKLNVPPRQFANITITEADLDKVLEDSKQELNHKLEKIGIHACEILQIPNREPELMQYIGRLKYRTSYGQNILYHSFEIAYFSALMAAEIGADIEVAKFGGFFHDLGKAIDQEVGGSHDYLSKEILEKFNFSWEIVHAAWTHHDAIPIETIEAQIVKAADAISAGRPGARSESGESYIEKIQGLEEIALNTKGIKKAFALSAGRELRTLVDETQIKDKDMPALAEKMAKEIEETIAYPGVIKVNLIRKFEAIDYANPNSNSST